MSKKDNTKIYAKCWDEFYTHILLLAYTEPDKTYTPSQIADMMGVTVDLNIARTKSQKPF